MTEFFYAPTLPVLASPPGSPEIGMLYVRQSDYQVLVYDGAAWVAQGSGASGQFRQSVFAQIAADTTTTSTAFVALMSANVTTTEAGFLLIDFSMSGTGSNASGTIRVEFQILVNGTPVRGTAIAPSANAPQSAACVLRYAAPTPGTFTVAVQWRVSASTGRIRPVSSITEHASLRVCEVGA